MVSTPFERSCPRTLTSQGNQNLHDETETNTWMSPISALPATKTWRRRGNKPRDATSSPGGGKTTLRSAASLWLLRDCLGKHLFVTQPAPHRLPQVPQWYTLAMSRGLFITLEGLDGSGKTTQIKRLAAWMQKRGLDSILTRQPGGTAAGDRIRALLLDSGSAPVTPMAEMALMFADRAQAIAEVIEPALAAGKVVLCDRFTDSTEAYQGGGRQLGSSTVRELHRLICGNLMPDLTLLLLPSLEASLARARRRNDRAAAQSGPDENRFEQEQEAFYQRVWEKYREIAAREPERVVLIEGNLTIDEVHEQIVEAVSERLIATGHKA
jgi:dTMP kinase